MRTPSSTRSSDSTAEATGKRKQVSTSGSHLARGRHSLQVIDVHSELKDSYDEVQTHALPCARGTPRW